MDATQAKELVARVPAYRSATFSWQHPAVVELLNYHNRMWPGAAIDPHCGTCGYAKATAYRRAMHRLNFIIQQACEGVST